MLFLSSSVQRINLANSIAPSFDKAFSDIWQHKHTHYWFKGGRGSTKSSCIALNIPPLIMSNPKYNCVVLRKVGVTLKKSVYNQLLWALDELGIREKFKITISPLEMTYIETGQKIVFMGSDDPQKIKSIKFASGYPAIVWFEELDQFFGMEEIRNLNQSLLRGGKDFWAFYSFNPPKSKNNWVNEEVLISQENRGTYHSTYLDVPREWLGELFFYEAELLKEKNERAYRHEYLGEATGTGGSIFENVTIREITDAEIAEMDEFNHSLDFGFSIDPCAYEKTYFHNNKLYFVDEIYEQKLSNKRLAKRLVAKGLGKEYLICDSAEPKSISELREYDINAIPCKKGADSVEYGVKWLQDLDEIIIDKQRTPNAAKEFIGYEYERNREGQFISKYPDKDNHTIDSTRYGNMFLIRQNRGRIERSK